MSTYSFMDVQASIVGPGIDADLGYGAQTAKEGIEFEAAADTNKMDVGSDGAGQHSLSMDKSGHITVRLLKTSPTNALLHAAYDAQRLNSSMHGQNVIVCTQTASGDVTTALQVAFKKKPRLGYAQEAGMMIWEFDAIHVDTVLGTY